MQYSLCIWGEAQVWTWGAHVVRGLSARYPYVSLNRTDIGSFLAHVRRFEVRGIVVRQGSCQPVTPYRCQPNLGVHKIDHQEERSLLVLY